MKTPLACVAAAFLVAAAPAGAACTAKSPNAKRVALKVAGQRSPGYASMPRRKPTALVVVAHGYSWGADSWKTKLRMIARDDRAVAVAPEFRGLRVVGRKEGGFESTRGIPLRKAMADLNAYTRSYRARCRSVKTVVLVGYSIGAGYSGNALMGRPKRTGGKPLYDYFVGMEAVEDIFGEFKPAEQIQGDAFIQGAIDDGAAELGGTVDEKPEAYHAVNPIEHVDRIKASGLKGAILVHGSDDGLVPYSQSVDMTKALRDHGIRTDLYTARKRRPGDDPDTTLSGRFGEPSGDSGHASDASTNHLVPETGLSVLHALLKGKRPANRDLDAKG